MPELPEEARDQLSFLLFREKVVIGFVQKKYIISSFFDLEGPSSAERRTQISIFAHYKT